MKKRVNLRNDLKCCVIKISGVSIFTNSFEIFNSCLYLYKDCQLCSIIDLSDFKFKFVAITDNGGIIFDLISKDVEIEGVKMERLMELVEKEKLTWDELEEIEQMEMVIEVEDNGMSGHYPGWHWYTVILEYGNYDVYVK